MGRFGAQRLVSFSTCSTQGAISLMPLWRCFDALRQPSWRSYCRHLFVSLKREIWVPYVKIKEKNCFDRFRFSGTTSIITMFVSFRLHCVVSWLCRLFQILQHQPKLPVVFAWPLSATLRAQFNWPAIPTTRHVPTFGSTGSNSLYPHSQHLFTSHVSPLRPLLQSVIFFLSTTKLCDYL